MSNSKRILILGASSYVGGHLFRSLGSSRALATYNSTPINGGVRYNSLNMKLADIIDQPDDFSHAVILLGDTQPDSCFSDKDRSDALNIESVISVFGQLVALNIKPVFTSSEFVFDGDKGNYIETDGAGPILLYGHQKLAAEKYLEGMYIPYSILRLAKVFGETLGDNTLFTGWLNNIKPDSNLKCATDQAFSPVFVGDVVKALNAAVDQDIEGTFHLSGNQRFTRLELLEMLLIQMKAFMEKSDINIERCSIHDFNLPEKRPLDVSMIADKLVAETGLQFVDIEQKCSQIAAKHFNNNSGHIT